MLRDFHDEAAAARLLDGGAALRFCQEEDVLTIELPAAPPDPVATVVAVTLGYDTTIEHSQKP